MNRFFTFRTATLFALALAVWNILLMWVVGLKTREQMLAAHHLLASHPVMTVALNVMIVGGFFAIFQTRNLRNAYSARVFIYAMLLGALLGELLAFGASALA